jgi:hypothetical protein
MKKLIITVAGLALAGGLAACGTTVTKVASPAAPASSAPSSASARAPAPQASSSPWSSPSSGPLSGPVGTTYEDTGANGPNGPNTVYAVTLVRVEQQAALTQYESLTNGSDHVTAGTNFNSGEFDVSPGQTVTGWVSFELAPGATMASIQWSPGAGSQTA